MPSQETPAGDENVADERKRPGLNFSRNDFCLLFAVLAFYAATRLTGIVDFPIYFFCDEAQQANLAYDLVADGFRDQDRTLFPAFFRNVRVFNLGFSVWVHALPVTVFGKSIAVVRGTSVVVGLLGAAALMLILKWFFRSRLWWAGGLVLAGLPAWFLHSRTAFETVMMVSFYCLFMLAYLLYREVSPRWLPVTVVCGAAVFYSYSNGQGVMLVSGLLLLAIDWRYHWRTIRSRPKLAVLTLVVVVLVAAPYLRFRLLLHPEMVTTHFHDLDSYWVEDGTTPEKFARFARTYAHGLSPGYWFFEDTEENVRHRMLGYPHLPVWLAPPLLLGFGVAIGRARRSSAHRLVLVGILAAPFAASLVDVGITRVLAMVVPATLLAVIGFDVLRSWLVRAVPKRIFDPVMAVGLAAATLAMTGDALANGALWFRDYGMGGMQWGAEQVFDELQRRLTEAPDQRFVVSHLWANNSDAFLAFFIDPPDQSRVRSGMLDDVLRRRGEVGPLTTFILTPDEYAEALWSRKLEVEEPSVVIRCPDNTPCFYFVHLAYTQEAAELFAAESAERRVLIDGAATLDGTVVQIRHPRFDMGSLDHVFDGDLTSMARTLDANPTRLEIRFAEPKRVAGLRLHLWDGPYKINAKATDVDDRTAVAEGYFEEAVPPGPRELFFSELVSSAVVLEIQIGKPGDGHIHLRGIEILDVPNAD